MKIHSLKRRQIIRTSLKEAWSFFSTPHNLKVITPPYMDFKITSPHPSEEIYAGMLISYIVRPVLRWPIHWVTEITQVEQSKFFIDEQRIGPYRLWHHQHFFHQVDEGVEMVDLVHYALPMGPIGRIMHHLFIKKQLNTIFDYRFEKIESLFNRKQVVNI
ncbi:MAG: SRPBCC family protein [Cyclobacteriaceae bacterium]